MVGELQPLSYQQRIVNIDGTPNEYFIRWAQQRQIDIGNGITAAQALAIVQQFTLDHPIIAGSGITLTPNGNIADDVTIAADVQAILDQISTTWGAVLFRGTADWQALAPGTSGDFLKTNGAGADPEWAAAGGGGSTPWYINTPAAATFTKVSGDATQLTVTDNADVGLLVNGGTPVGGQISRIAYHTLSNKALAWDLQAKLKVMVPNIANSGVGVYLMDSISGRTTSFDVLRDGSTSGVFQWASLSSFSSSPFNTIFQRPLEWVRITSNGTTLSFQISESGKQWLEVLSITLTSFLTNKPDRIGFGTNLNRTTGLNNLVTVNYFALTGPGV